MITYKHVLICGGSGKRLWPLSRENYPKPFLQLNDGPSLFQDTILRNNQCNNHLIITNERLQYQAAFQEQNLQLSKPVSYLLESTGRNTGPAILLSCLDSKDDEFIVVTPADHLIQPVTNYQNDIQSGLALAQQKNGIVLIGIQPTYPSTEYGYINSKETMVSEFKEKPNIETATSYIEKGTYKWNSGIFIFKAGLVKQLFKEIAPEAYNIISTAYNNRKKDGIVDLTLAPSMSFDRDILEKTNNIYVIPNTFDWSDVGCFDELEQLTSANQSQINVNSSNTYSFTTSEKTVAFHDVNDIYMIETNDSVLIGKKTVSKNVLNVVEAVGKSNKTLLNHSNIVYRPWGYYSILFESDTYKVKRIIIYPNRRLSLQRHKFRSEHWTCVIGQVHVVNNESTKTLLPNESIYIEKGHSHRIENKSSEISEIIEVQCGSYLGEDDIERIESDY
ncbi:MAG: mannose-1-phosphate guanylyltransferase/mannose-6-phosphate isomerase [Candidatus Marinamargulisbacteria bacterium]